MTGFSAARRTTIRVVLLAVAGLALSSVRSAEAIPAFARKYATSCQTCHTMFPKLNAFGTAFRLNGYRMPKETEEMVKEKPVSLGAPAYKKLWPHAVWPGEVSSSVPLAVNVKFADVNTSALNEDGTTESVKNDFQFPQEVNIFGAGTLGDHVSYFSEVTFGVEGDGSVSTEIEHAHLGIDSPFGPENILHFRIGKFTPNVADVFQEMFITTDAAIDSLFAYNPIGPNGGTGLAEDVSPTPVAFPELVQGLEAYGVAGHRLFYTAGVVNGIGGNGRFDGNDAKDLYARLDYKIGGMGLDGDMGGREAPDKNWRDDSLRLGAFVYRGDGRGIDFESVSEEGDSVNIQDDRFLRTGFFASAYWRDLNLFGAYVHGTDTLRQFSPDSAEFLGEVKPTYNAWFGQADYVFYPWLLGAVRYETLTPGDRSVQSLRTGVVSVSGLIRANVKAMVEYQRDMREAKNHSFNAILRFAF
jgi:hypothetical protein